MPATSILPPFAQFTDRSGEPLDNGFIYIGSPGLEAQTNPIVAYWDDAFSVPAAQPIRTLGGYPVYNGTPARVYVPTDFSITVLDNDGAFVYSSLTGAFAGGGSGLSAFYADRYTATAGQTTFTLTTNPASINALDVSVNGSTLVPGDDFTWVSTTVTLTAPMVGGERVLIRYTASAGTATVLAGSVTDVSVATGSKLYNRINDWVSVKDFGAVGDGVTDDTAAIQAAINSLPLNTADVGILTPKGFAQGGQIYFPRGRYKVTSTITMRRGLHICGEAREASQIISFTSGSVFKYADAGRYIQDEILIENLSIWQDSTVVANTGAGIEVFLGPASIESVGIILRNIYIEKTYRGVLLGAGVWCSIDNVDVFNVVLYGFDVRYTTAGVGTSTSTTSTTFKNCYASLCGHSGFRIERGAYCSFVSCASDSNTQYGYVLEGQGQGHTLLACGAEENGIGGCLVKDSTGCVVNLFAIFNGDAIGTGSNTRHGIVCDNARNLTVQGGIMAANGVATGYGIHVVLNGSNITCVGTEFLGNYIGAEVDAVYKVLMLTAGNGLVGNKNKWAIGAVQQPETDATFAVSGYMDAASNYALKILALQTAANGTRNAAQFTQAVTDNTAVTYPLVIGSFIANTSKGAASTITRSAGSYIVQQTQGGTANANLMIDAGSGTVPAGTWSIYNDSTRENLFKGPIRWGTSGPLATFGAGSPEGVVTAPVGSTYQRTDGGAATSFYVKESGTGNTGWVGK